MTIQPGELYHLPGCREVAMEPVPDRAKGKGKDKPPGKRVTLSVMEVRRWVGDGRLDRGCRKCGANAMTPRQARP